MEPPSSQVLSYQVKSYQVLSFFFDIFSRKCLLVTLYSLHLLIIYLLIIDFSFIFFFQLHI